LTVIWCLAAGALVVAGAALLKSRRTSQQLARLSESYWQLRYEHGQLSSRLDRIEASLGQSPNDSLPSAASTTTAFVPLSSLRR
jgi:hypothetical protein